MNKQPNVLLAFFQELLQRFFTKSPKFFRIWQLITAIGTAITGIPEFLGMFNIVLPHPYDIFSNKFIAAVSLGMFIMSAATAQSKPVAVFGITGDVLKKTDEKALPFTAAQESKFNAKSSEELPIVTP